MDRDGLAGLADFDGHAVIFDQKPELLGEIIPEQVRTRHAGLMHSRPCDKSVREPRIQPGVGRGGEPHKRIAGAHPRRQRPAIGIGFKAIAEEFCVALVNLFQPIDRGFGICERFRGDGRGNFERHAGYIFSP